MKTDVKGAEHATVLKMCNVKEEDIWVFTSFNYNSITALKRLDRSPVWEISSYLSEEKIQPVRLTCDDVGRIYVADDASKQLLIFDSLDGELLQEIELEKIETI